MKRGFDPVLDYAIVVATRNRLEALRASVPLFLGQSRAPARLIVVDRSDDHAAVAAWLADIAQGTTIPIEVIHADQANSSHQRNLGLARVREPVTLLPDDDSLWFPDTAAKFMEVYDRDTGGLIGGVAGIPSNVSPLAAMNTPSDQPKLSVRGKLARSRVLLEDQLVPHPFKMKAKLFIPEIYTAVSNAGLGDLKPVEIITGFRMSFRTDLARELQFDPVLGSRIGYAVGEDSDIGLRVQKAGYLLAAAPGARVFHNTHPGKRAGGFAYGFMWLFNYAYICRKVFGDAPPGRGPVLRYLRYKQFLYRLRIANSHHRDIARGGAAALAEFDRIWQASDDHLAEVYGEVCDRVLARA